MAIASTSCVAWRSLSGARKERARSSLRSPSRTRSARPAAVRCTLRRRRSAPSAATRTRPSRLQRPQQPAEVAGVQVQACAELADVGRSVHLPQHAIGSQRPPEVQIRVHERAHALGHRAVEGTDLLHLVHISDSSQISRRCQPNGRMAGAHEAGIDFRGVAKRALFFAVVAVLAVVALAALPGIDEVRTEFSNAEPGWIVAAAGFRLLSMLGFVRALWSAFDRVMPWRRALVLGLAEQGANVLLPGGRRRRPGLRRLRAHAPRRARRPRVPAPRRALPRDQRRELRRDHPRGRADRGRHPARGRVADHDAAARGGDRGRVRARGALRAQQPAAGAVGGTRPAGSSGASGASPTTACARRSSWCSTATRC